MKTHVLAIGFSLAAGAVSAQGFQGADVGMDLTRNTGDFNDTGVILLNPWVSV